MIYSPLERETALRKYHAALSRLIADTTPLTPQNAEIRDKGRWELYWLFAAFLPELYP